jgi:threonine aldolase
LIALRDMRNRLADDHKNAALLASMLLECGYAVEQTPRRTNMVYFGLSSKYENAADFADICGRRGLLVGIAGAGRIRMVTHLGLDEGSVRKAAEILKELGA